jgi:hypothetical protein
MKSIFISFVMLALASSAAVAQDKIPKGWFLHDDLSPTLNLAYYNPVSGEVDISLECTTGYSDLIVAFYPRSGGMIENKKVKLELRNSNAVHSIDATGKTYNGRYTLDGPTTMQPSLGKLILDGFTVVVDGRDMGTYAPNGNDSAHVRKLTEACIGQPSR